MPPHRRRTSNEEVNPIGAQGDRIFAAIAERGFPAPWNAFGECMSWEAAYAVQLKTAIDAARKDNDEGTRAGVEALFTLKQANLAKARRILANAMSDYDRNGTWNDLDQRTATLAITALPFPGRPAPGTPAGQRGRRRDMHAHRGLVSECHRHCLSSPVSPC